ncbi:DNA polymerase interacting tetratricopeptide repeat-containing, protein of 47 kDa isoform X1 [Diprion similis]|uniref:DNA polymerase interacting tetratricopeptide repeat-containing, protein of 47 kDa isoform X1 n=1 Tax=Diprion similis TaxID=362088 RepID=UPI001EF86CDE|nr:DNA polymerase interacting tetratricopeptide repeat-containing, protein of 47 kDa isoform X1 [Diprion similis]XP_046752522.1 DNA polymerase interacting tetratricopeptide repeat-containing, protein of 47 kDa isoform X1 [Diprion similis]
MNAENINNAEKKSWTEAERLELAAKLDAELDDYINNLERKQYTEGWPEDRWEAEMDKHPFFMKKAPQVGDELSPLMEGLQQLKYDENENTPEELANNYKEDGNFNFKYKNYRLAIMGYTEGIRTKCKDDDLMAQLYNNRAAAHYMLQNYRSSLNDCKHALKLKPDYPKAWNRAANCCSQIKDYDQCITYCDQFLEKSPSDKVILNLRNEAVANKKKLERDKRRTDALAKKIEREEETLLEIIQSRGVNIELGSGKRHLQLSDLEPCVPQIAQNRVHLVENGRLVWPVIILYPETHQTDFIQEFHEDTRLITQLEELFEESPGWDTGRRYYPKNVNVYFEGKGKRTVHKIDVEATLGKILADQRFEVRGGTPAFLVLVASSEAEKRFLANY